MSGSNSGVSFKWTWANLLLMQSIPTILVYVVYLQILYEKLFYSVLHITQKGMCFVMKKISNIFLTFVSCFFLLSLIRSNYDIVVLIAGIFVLGIGILAHFIGSKNKK